MSKEELVKCPVCGVLSRADRPEFSAALADPEIRHKIENYVAQLVEQTQLAGVAKTPEPRNFQTDVHNWNPALPMWQRSPKE